jgi:outer membrane protein
MSMKKSISAAIVLSGALLAGAAQPAGAQDLLKFFTAEAPGGGFSAGNLLIHGRVIGVLPNTDANADLYVGALGGHVPPAGQVTISQTVEPEADATYFITDNIAAEVIAGTTKHSLTLKGTAANTLACNGCDITIGTARLLPPTLTAKFYPFPHSAFSPYIAAGINYTWFFDVHPSFGGSATSLNLAQAQVHLQDSWGGVVQAGIDYNIADNWYLNLDIKQIFLTAPATVTSSSLGGVKVSSSVTINPTIVGFGVGYKF